MSESIFGPNASIDIAQLQNADLVFVTKALSANSKEITQRLNTTLKEYLKKGEIRGGEPAFLAAPDYPKGPRWYAALWGKVGHDSAKGSVLPLLLPIAVFLYDSYGLAPSKFLLNTETKTTLPQWLQNWLAQAEVLSTQEYNRLCDILDEGEIVRCDTIYTLKSRISELAAARGNSKIASVYNPRHEAVIRMIGLVVDNAHAAGIPVGICGELASDEQMAAKFVEMGVDELSVTPGAVLGVRKAVLEAL